MTPCARTPTSSAGVGEKGREEGKGKGRDRGMGEGNENGDHPQTIFGLKECHTQTIND